MAVTERFVLVVEDDPIIAFDLESVLTDLGYHGVRLFRENESAIRWLATERPDFAILDYKLASGTSMDTAAVLLRDRVPMVFVTGYGEDLPLPDAFAGCPVLSKPIDKSALSALLPSWATSSA